MSTAHLIEKIQAIETRAYSDPVSSLGRQAFSVPTGWEALDSSLHVASEGSYLPGLACGVVHEWFGLSPSGRSPSQRHQARSQARCQARHDVWLPPLTVLSHLALRASTVMPGSFVVWIGRRCWPSLWHLTLGHGEFGQHERSGVDMLDRSVFVDPANRAARLWAIDLSVRCAAVCAVVADGTSFDLAATRRLQVAVTNRRALVLLTRSPREIKQLSAAATRWHVCCAESPTRSPRFNLELLRCKMPQQLRGGLTHGQSWLVESDHETGCRSVPAVLADRSATPLAKKASVQPVVQSVAL